jgi:hypothetical protein
MVKRLRRVASVRKSRPRESIASTDGGADADVELFSRFQQSRLPALSIRQDTVRALFPANHLLESLNFCALGIPIHSSGDML